MNFENFLARIKQAVESPEEKDLVCNAISDYYGDLVCIEVEKSASTEALEVD